MVSEAVDSALPDVVVLHGVLGWGNRKGGLEAYGPDGRWGGGGHYADHGDLLGDALERRGATEGSTLVVVAVTRRVRENHEAVVDAVEQAIQSALSGSPHREGG